MDESLKTIGALGDKETPCYADFANYLAVRVLLKGIPISRKGKFFADVKHYYCENLHLWRVGADLLPRRCVSGTESWEILKNCHEGPTRGHFTAN